MSSDKKSNPVTESGLPPMQYGMGMQQVTFVDVEAKFEDEIYKFPKLNSNDNVRFYQENNTFISDSPDAVITELDSMYRMGRQVLDAVPYHQKEVAAHEVGTSRKKQGTASLFARGVGRQSGRGGYNVGDRFATSAKTGMTTVGACRCHCSVSLVPDGRSTAAVSASDQIDGVRP